MNPSSEFDANMIDIPMLAYTLMQSRQTILPKRLVEPGPNTAQLEELFKAAATAPDHGLQRPWRFVLIPTCARHLLAETFATALLQRDAMASIEAIEQARDKAYRAPVLMLAVVHTGGENPRIPLNERLTSAGCALQNILLTATAQGFGSALTSGETLQSAPLRELFSLKTDELALCFLSVGTASSRKPIPPRPAPCDFVNILGDTDTPIPQHFLISTSVCNETLDQRLLRSEKT